MQGIHTYLTWSNEVRVSWQQITIMQPYFVSQCTYLSTAVSKYLVLRVAIIYLGIWIHTSCARLRSTARARGGVHGGSIDGRRASGLLYCPRWRRSPRTAVACANQQTHDGGDAEQLQRGGGAAAAGHYRCARGGGRRRVVRAALHLHLAAAAAAGRTQHRRCGRSSSSRGRANGRDV
jgi:hypothetical protein